MKKIIGLIIIVVFMVSAIALLAIPKQQVLNEGERIFLKTIPVDPRDPFRGDYVTLRYDISTLDVPFEDGVQTVYVALSRSGDYYSAVDYFLEPPEGVYIKGQANIMNGHASLTYGIEQLFVPEGTGKDLETAARSGELLVEVALFNGDAVITGYKLDGVYTEI